MHPLGVGLVYQTELDALFREGNPDLSVLELEPETFWEELYPSGPEKSPVYLPNQVAMARIQALPQHKLVHSVGFPVGGSVSEGGDYLQPLVRTINSLGAPWVSEHLSFNAVQTPRSIESVGFLLPPRQTRAGAQLAVSNISRLTAQLSVPFAFETGVNYLQPRSDEMRDGEFFSEIAEQANCGILLDLHNLWVNQRNGRQTLAAVIEDLPLDRVWEIHLAGGMMLGDYYLDSHSDTIANELLELAATLIPRLPNLGAIIFEMLPEYVSKIGMDRIREELAVLNGLWRLRPVEVLRVPRRPAISSDWRHDVGDIYSWEQTLGRLVTGHLRPDSDCQYQSLARDPGVKVLEALIGEFRDAQIARAMRFTTTVLLASLGRAAVHELLGDYHRESFPRLFASGEADRFAWYLKGRIADLPPTPFLAEVLNFEHALLRAAVYGEKSRIEWKIDPEELFDALNDGRVPEAVRSSNFWMDIVPG